MSTQLTLDDANIRQYLIDRQMLSASDSVRVGPAGDGNINWVRRVRIEGDSPRSMILKQARPQLERFPEYEAPTERLVFEARFYEDAAGADDEGLCPAVLAFDEPNRVLVLEDLGDCERLDAALARGADVTATARRLARFLGRLHAATERSVDPARYRNSGMQRLHGDHIFALPFAENDFALPPETEHAGRALHDEGRIGECAARAYARYLEPRGALLHGDVQAANVLVPPTGARLLDAEIAHVGDPAFDLGQWIAHLALPALARGSALDARDAVAAACAAYADARALDPGAAADAIAAAAVYAGLELLRRTLGAARTPAVESDDAGLRVIKAGRRWVLDAPDSPEALLGAA